VHLSVADEQGGVRGGHVMSGCVVHITCELVVGDMESLAFGREPGPLPGYRELVVLLRQP
jgi:uncharacterized protein